MIKNNFYKSYNQKNIKMQMKNRFTDIFNIITSLVPKENSFRTCYSNFSQTARVAVEYRTILREIFAADL